MKQRLLTTLLLFTLAFSAARATHMSGGEIYWDCLGNNQYRITLVVYRDCAGINVDPNYDLDITSPCGSTTLTVSTPGGTELSQLCDTELPNSTCNGGSLPGIEQYIYTGVVTLQPCDFWTISWTNIWRNNAISNLMNPGSQPMYIEATLNNTVDPCDDSPTFTNLAIPYVCLNYPVTYSYGTVDPEADSLSYQLIDARSASGTPITYMGVYTGAQPITGLTLDPVTGQLNFTPTQSGNWVVVVLVTEYDANGNVIGTVMRDMQFVAYPCANVPPDASTGNVGSVTGMATQTGPHSVEVCESGNFCFSMTISDANAANILEATSNVTTLLPGATFNYTGTNPITCTVCWNAAPGTAGFYPFIVSVNDGACPIVGIQTYVYSITVIEGLQVDVDVTDASCAGMNDGTATVNILAGTGPYDYLWGSTGQTTPGITAGAGTYPVTITDANGCVATPNAAVINAPNPPVANAGADQVACFGAWPILLQSSATNATSTSWSNGGGVYSGIFPNTSYTPNGSEISSGGVDLILTALGSGGCPPDQDTMHISISNTFVNASVTAVNATCNGTANGSATASPNNASIDYVWNTNPVQYTATATGLAAGNYSVTLTDVLNCSTTLNTTITAPTAISIANVQVTNETCAGVGNGSVTVTASGGTPPYQYNWDNGATTPTINVGAGTYTVSITDTYGCTPATATATVTATAQPGVANAGADVIGCLNTIPVQLQGSVANASGGIWSGGAGSFTGAGLNVSYMPTNAEIAFGGVNLVLTTTGNNGCPADMDTVHVSLSNAFLNASISASGVLCNGGSTGSASFVPNMPGLIYLWNDPAQQTTATATNLASGTYTISVTDPLGCDTLMSVFVPQPPTLAVSSISGIDPTCSNSNNGSASVAVNGGTPGYTYQWSSNTGGQTTPTATGLGGGSYYVTITDAAGCSTQGNIQLLAPPAITLSAQVPDTVCVNAPVQLFAQANGGDGNYTINWLGIGQGPSLTYSFPSSQTVTVSVTDGSGCPGPTLSMLVTVLNLSTATLVPYGDTTVCEGGSANVGAIVAGYPGAVTLSWPQLGTQGSGPFNVPVANDQTLTVIASNTCGQTLTGTVTLDLEIPPSITLPPLIAEGCAPLTVTMPDSLTTQPVTYFWQFGDGSSSTGIAPTHTYAAGNWIVSLIVTTPAGCTMNALNTGEVMVYAGPQAAFTANFWSTDMDSPTFQFTGQSTGLITRTNWSFGDGDTSVMSDPSHTYSDVGTYPVTLMVTDANGCTNEVTHDVQILPVYDIEIPNAFTPDPNGGSGGGYDPTGFTNDVFFPFVRFVKDFQMRIWNRWGELVFESNDINTGWDGYYRDKLSQQDVYIYRIWIRFIDDREADRMGDLTLFR